MAKWKGSELQKQAVFRGHKARGICPDCFCEVVLRLDGKLYGHICAGRYNGGGGEPSRITRELQRKVQS